MTCVRHSHVGEDQGGAYTGVNQGCGVVAKPDHIGPGGLAWGLYRQVVSRGGWPVDSR